MILGIYPNITPRLQSRNNQPNYVTKIDYKAVNAAIPFCSNAKTELIEELLKGPFKSNGSAVDILNRQVFSSKLYQHMDEETGKLFDKIVLKFMDLNNEYGSAISETNSRFKIKAEETGLEINIFNKPSIQIESTGINGSRTVLIQKPLGDNDYYYYYMLRFDKEKKETGDIFKVIKWGDKYKIEYPDDHYTSTAKTPKDIVKECLECFANKVS